MGLSGSSLSNSFAEMDLSDALAESKVGNELSKIAHSLLIGAYEKRRDFATIGFLACSGMAAYMMGQMVHPHTYSKVQLQTLPNEGQEVSFGVAAEQNLVFTPDQAASKKPEKPQPDVARYKRVKMTTRLLDYAFLTTTFYFYNKHVSGEQFSPSRAAAVIPIHTTGLYCLEVVKAYLFSDVVAEAKVNHMKRAGRELIDLFSFAGIKKIGGFLGKLLCGEGVWRDFKDKNEARFGVLYHFFYFFKIGWVNVPAASYLQTALGLYTCAPLQHVVRVFGVGQWWECRLTVLGMVYLEYLLMSFIKDALSMNILHQMMHKQWYPMHSVHHMPMKELSIINHLYFDMPDVVIENVIAPVVLLGVKLLANPSSMPTLHYLSYILLNTTDSNLHSICPYTIGFYNPVLDATFNCNVSHHLHHALNTGYYTVWPWHQLKGVSHYSARKAANVDSSPELDMEAYNITFGTNFPA